MLAEKIGVSRQAVSKWELGEATPDLNKMVLLADVFDVSLDNLCGRQETMRNVQANQKEGRKHWPIISLILVVVILKKLFFM